MAAVRDGPQGHRPLSNVLPLAAVAGTATALVGSVAFATSSSGQHAPSIAPDQQESLAESHFMARKVQPATDSRSLSFQAPVGIAVAATTVATASATASRRMRGRVARAGAAQPEIGMSRALPFMRVPSPLTNNPLDTQFPGDFGFDPAGLSSEVDSPLKDYEAYLADVFSNFGLPSFEKLRWYREAELAHGRVAMLACFNILLRESGDGFGILPDMFVERGVGAIVNFVEIMLALEFYRGYRLLFNQAALAGDLGLGMGLGEPLSSDVTLEQLAEKQCRELQNGRVAMIGFLGLLAQYCYTGVWVLPSSEFQRMSAALSPQTDDLTGTILQAVACILAIDGIRRLSSLDTPQASVKSSDIAQKAINPFALTVGVQDPGVPLPAGVVAGSPPQELRLTPEQIVQFEEDGCIMIKGAMTEWVSYLSAVTDYQIEHPHVWSLVGRMSGLYDYIQRNTWMTNNGFRDFMYYSPLGSVLSQLGRSPEIRVSTDMLLVNPNKGFGWHQDNQNGPIEFSSAIRWWVAMDRCGEGDYGAPEYLLGSHKNTSVGNDAVFVDLAKDKLEGYDRKTKFVAEPGDLIVWDSRTIHRIVAPPGGAWTEGMKRRALGGTAAKAGAAYLNKGGASAISDLAGHSLKSNEPLGGPYFPRIYPSTDEEERRARANGEILGRSPKRIADLALNLAVNAGKYISFSKVVGKK